MSFFMVTHGRVHPHQFNYLVDENGERRPRLEKTLPGGLPPQAQSSFDNNESSLHFVIEKMSKDVFTIDELSTVEEATQLLTQKKFHHLPVAKDGKIVGMLSDRDLLKLNGDTLFKLISVKDIMGSIVICCDEETELIEVAKVFVKEMVSALPVIKNNGEILGIITKMDLLDALISH